MLRSLYSAVSGIDVNQKSMDVIGNNIANVNTIGFKTGRAVFQDMLSQTLTAGKTPSDSRGGINPRQVGSGAYLVAVDNIFEQGVIKTTARTHDIAIEGNGFFVLRGEGTDKYYSRAGDFNFDRTGYLVSPSGYRVQGWMADPVTGVLEYNTQSKDLYITEAHKTMQAKATTGINYAGILDTRATSSMYDFTKMLTQASETQNIFSLLDDSGSGLDLSQTDKVRVRAHIAKQTVMGDIANADGQPVNLQAGKSAITMNVGGTDYTFRYVSSDSGAANGDFNTMEDLVDELNDVFDNNAAFGTIGSQQTLASLKEGKLTITCASTVTFKIDSFSSTSNLYMNNILEKLSGTYSGNGKSSAEMFYQQDINAGNDFKDLGELASQVDGVINGSVITGGAFKAEYLDNNFGLNDGERISIVTDQFTATFTYKTGSASATLNQFHTVNDLAQLIAAHSNGYLQVQVVGNSFDVQLRGGMGPITFNTVDTLGVPPATATGASPYLDGILQKLEGVTLNTGNTSVHVEEIAGKGRLAYSMDSVTIATASQTLSGFSVMKLTSGDIFNTNVLIDQGGTLTSGDSTSSYQFLTTATEDTLLVDLFNLTGDSFDFTEGVTTINFKANVDKIPLTAANSYTVAVNSTVKDMMTALEQYLQLGDSFNKKQNVTITDGVMSVIGEEGGANDITGLSMSAEPVTTLNTFYNFGTTAEKTQAATGGRFVTDMTIYDQQGNEHVVKFDFALFNSEKNEWAMRISTDDPYAKLSINGATTNELVMRFNANGTPSYMYDRFATPIHVVADPTINYDPGNGTNTISNIDLNLGTTGKFDGLVISAANNSLSLNDQDGYALGVLQDKLFNPAGEIVGYYTNGEIRTIGQVALATFQNNQGLMKVGDTMFAETGNSGQAAIGVPQSGSRGQIASSALEQSNVDLSSEFVNMIVTQRGFQANSRVVTTSDEMIQELLNLKR